MKNFKLRRTAAIIGYTVLAVVFTSCTNYLPTRNAIKEPYVINKIEEWTKTMCKHQRQFTSN